MANADSVLNYKFDNLARRISTLEVSQGDNIAKSERSGVAFTARIYQTLADAPLSADGNTDFALGFIASGRKAGEGAGLGTGVLSWYDPTLNQWLRASDDTAVVE